MVTAELIKNLRDKTGASINECKKALEESGGDLGRAEKVIEKKLGSLAGKRVGRKTGAGIVDAYIHSDKRIGVLVELFSETDFVARNPEFVMLAHGLALHIAALGPQYLSRDSVPDEIVNAERARFEEEVQRLGKPEKIMREIIDRLETEMEKAQCIHKKI